MSLDDIDFKNRQDAGWQLAEMLWHYRLEQPLVLALPRGGVPVGYEIAKSLHGIMDTIVSRKLSHPQHPEVGIGAIAPENIIVWDTSSLMLHWIEAGRIKYHCQKGTKRDGPTYKRI